MDPFPSNVELKKGPMLFQHKSPVSMPQFKPKARGFFLHNFAYKKSSLLLHLFHSTKHSFSRSLFSILFFFFLKSSFIKQTNWGRKIERNERDGSNNGSSPSIDTLRCILLQRWLVPHSLSFVFKSRKMFIYMSQTKKQYTSRQQLITKKLTTLVQLI